MGYKYGKVVDPSRSKKKVIYTCLVGGYEELFQPNVIDRSFDYICFSNDIADTNVGVWKIKRIPYEDKNLTRLSRYVKLLPHKVLCNYDYSIWLDANIQITGKEFFNFIDKRIEEQALIAQVPHSTSKDVYHEIRNAYYGEKVDWRSARRQMRYLQKMGFPEGLGVFENNIILRKHNDEKVKSISEVWWHEFCSSAPRDQFSLSYVYWKFHFTPVYLFDSKHNTRNVSFLEYHVHPSMQRRNVFYKKHRLLRALNALKKWIVVKMFLR